MNKFLMLAFAAFTFAVATPVLADHHMEADTGVEATVETTVDGDVVAEETTCTDADGNTVECEEHDDHANHDHDDVEVETDVEVTE